MKQLAMTVNLRDDPDAISAYRAHHRAVWPEVLDGLKKAGVESMQIYLLGRRLFMIASVADEFDPRSSFRTYLEFDPRCNEWEHLMGSLQEPVAEAGRDEKWAEMELVFST